MPAVAYLWKEKLRDILAGGQCDQGVFHDCVEDEPESAAMDVTEGNLPNMKGAEGDAATEVPGGRLLKGTLEGSSQDGAGIRQPSAPAGLPSTSCTGGGIVEGVGKGDETSLKEMKVQPARRRPDGLPPRWVQYTSSSGRAYYYHEVTCVSQ